MDKERREEEGIIVRTQDRQIKISINGDYILSGNNAWKEAK